MPTLKREMFLRPNRMTHRFGKSDDPLQANEYFEAPYPNGIKEANLNGKGRYGIKENGLHVYTKPFSPIAKFSGDNASLSGPRMDVADEMADPVPASTMPRRTQGPVIPRRKSKGD